MDLEIKSSSTRKDYWIRQDSTDVAVVDTTFYNRGIKCTQEANTRRTWVTRVSCLKGMLILIIMSFAAEPFQSLAATAMSNPPHRNIRTRNNNVADNSLFRQSILMERHLRLETLQYYHGSRISPLDISRGGGQDKIRSFDGDRRKRQVASSSSQKKNKKQQKGEDEVKVTAHHTDPRLMFMIKLLFITYYGSLGALMPYLPVYYHSLGHSGQAIGLLGAVKPLTTFIVAPLWGIISDYSQKPTFVLQLTFLTSMVLQLMLPLRDNVNYLVGMVFITALFNAPVKSLIDSMVMDKLDKDDRGQYGRLRLFGQLGFGIGSSIVGHIITRSTSQSSVPSVSPAAGKLMQEAMDVTIEAGAAAAATEESTKTAYMTLSEYLSSSVESLSNIKGYKLAFVAYGLLSIPAFICMKAFQHFDKKEQTKVENKVQEENVIKDNQSRRIMDGMKMLFHNGDAMLFFFLVFVVGTTSGIIENFAYVRIREVGGTGKEMGICRLVSSLSGAPMFWFSGPLTQLLGADRVLVLSLCSYILRFLNYAFMRHPFHALPAESLRGVTFAAFWSTCTVFAHKISPPGMSATMLLFMNAMYGGLGQSVGAIVGGKLQSKLGTVKTFLTAAIADFMFVIFVTIYLSMRKDSSFRNPKQISMPDAKDR